jgi:hypothetical protein
VPANIPTGCVHFTQFRKLGSNREQPMLVLSSQLAVWDAQYNFSKWLLSRPAKSILIGEYILKQARRGDPAIA